MNIFKNKNILITGGTGTIGSSIIYKLLSYKPAVIRIYSRDESKQAGLKEKLGHQKGIRYLIGDIRDKDRLRMAAKDIDIIFHTAALKHVLACEYNPFETVKTNILGTQNIIEVALENRVERVALTSSDKAVNPSNTMGVSKLMAEKLMIAANAYKGRNQTKFFVVRFGNILGSRGSVIPVFKEQIKKGGPLTITDPAMTRFIMSINDAVKLLIKTSLMAKGGEIFVLKMPVINIGVLAQVLLAHYEKKGNLGSRNITIKMIGTRPGEKLYEELMTPQELERAIELMEMFVIFPFLNIYNRARYTYPQTRVKYKDYYSSDKIPCLSPEEILLLLQKEGLI